jgi:DNA-binding NtrC family response regulator
MTGSTVTADRSTEPTILVVDDSVDVSAGLCAILRQRYHSVYEANSAPKALSIMRDTSVDLMISDISMPEMDGLTLLSKVKEISPRTIVILVTGYGSVESAVDAMKRGAYHYIAKPFRGEEILLQVERALQKLSLEREVEDLRRRVADQEAFGGIIAQSKKMLDVFDFIRKVAPTDAPVLIRGESGTGKELIARSIHRESGRREAQFLGINTAALPEALLEAELFGYKKGAFTGATADKEGLLTAAKGGTVFLDEISRMPLSSQAKLLRAIEEMEVLPVGGLNTVRINARFVSATNSQDLKDIREDLFYRLSVMEIWVPPLRERMEDVPLLATRFVEVYAKRFGRGAKRLTPAALEALTRYRWPGNVRELENVIQRAVVVSAGEDIDVRDIQTIGQTPGAEARTWTADTPYETARDEAMLAFQRQYMANLLKRSGGNVSKAAQAAGITRSALYAILKKTGLDGDGPRGKR